MRSCLDRVGAEAYARTEAYRRRVDRALRALASLEGVWVVSWSGGKDSGVCVDLAGRAWRDGHVLVSDNGTDSDEIARLVEEMSLMHQHLRFHARRSLETEQEDRESVRAFLRGVGAAGQVLGLRARESGFRTMIARAKIENGIYMSAASWGGLPIMCPIVWWSLDDVISYTLSRGLPYHRVYDRDGWQARSPHRINEHGRML